LEQLKQNELAAKVAQRQTWYMSTPPFSAERRAQSHTPSRTCLPRNLALDSYKDENGATANERRTLCTSKKKKELRGQKLKPELQPGRALLVQTVQLDLKQMEPVESGYSVVAGAVHT
jgi:hypothetical protein